MKTQTLKTLINQACDDACKNNYLSSHTEQVVSEMRNRIFFLIDLYVEDNLSSACYSWPDSPIGVPNSSIDIFKTYSTLEGGGQ